jgi:hypothetical protein
MAWRFISMWVTHCCDLYLEMCSEPQHFQGHITPISLFKIQRAVSTSITLARKEWLETVLLFSAEKYIRLASPCYVRT